MIDIKRFRKEQNVSQSELCEVLNVKQPYISAIENGKRPLSEEKLSLLYKRYGDIIMTYKTTERPIIIANQINASGEGEMQNADANFNGNSDISNNDSNKGIITKTEETATWVLLLPVSAQGGSLNDFIVSVKESDCEKVVSPIRGVDFAMTVSGDSMSPEYPNGSRVFIKRINEKAFIEWGKVYVLDTCNGTVIKILVPSEKEGYVKCVSINTDPIFAPFDVSLDDIYGIYKVLLCMSVK